MAATIPSLTQTVDTIFTTTWYEMQKKAIDNILDNNVLSALLREAGCFKPQVGEKFIERTIRYGKKTAITVAKGDTLPTGEDELDTAAFWKWKYLTSHIQRSLQDDQQNAGAGKIRSLVQSKIEAARDALDEKYEDSLLKALDTTGTAECRLARDLHSVWNFLDETGTTATYHPTTGSTYKYGGIVTAGVQTAGSQTLNHWWQAKYLSATSPALMNLIDQMRTLYNNCTGSGGNDHPDIILTCQELYEAYEDLMGSSIQLVADVGSRTASLGYDLLKYKGAKVAWTSNSAIHPAGTATNDAMLFLNSRWIDVVYDPELWFTMLPWQPLPNQLERITRIVCASPGMICYQLRRQGLLMSYTS